MAKNTCKTCGGPSLGEYCFRHKPRTRIKSNPVRRKSFGALPVNQEGAEQMWEFFMELWKIRPHYCASCGKWLGVNPKTYMFDHLIEKAPWPDFKCEPENIFLCCADCHGKKSSGFPTDVHKTAIERARRKFIYGE